MALAEKYLREGHPTIDELIADQRVLFPRDPRDLLGDFWPEDESIDGFLGAMRDWRGHAKTKLFLRSRRFQIFPHHSQPSKSKTR
jgi:hypothetical protein